MNTRLFDNYNKKDKNDRHEIIINATKIVANDISAEIYEFVLDQKLELIACGYMQSVSQGKIKPITNLTSELDGALFELNHVRVNPQLNNELILHRFKKLLSNCGVQFIAPPEEILMAMCYKPIGELSDVVRFYLNIDIPNNTSSLVFLSPSVKLSLI